MKHERQKNLNTLDYSVVEHEEKLSIEIYCYSSYSMYQKVGQEIIPATVCIRYLDNLCWFDSILEPFFYFCPDYIENYKSVKKVDKRD